ncbi:hypothetical protein NM688_g623 [Phlebia brevispora]|uniref:Uncharacterized protein n=1 Tax=Phlebia brevispora TaxID=194682 RepID=A0ACC1TE45_9APHY|nr:hypothetical protein NM688_g623 [Phlebia brevispora]
MSSSMPDPAAIRALLLSNYSNIAALAFVSYEHMITIPHEYEFLGRKWTGATWLFLANRYFLLAAIIAEAVPENSAMLEYFFGEIFSCFKHPASRCSGRILFTESLCVTGSHAYVVLQYQDQLADNAFTNIPVLGPTCYGIYKPWVTPALVFHRKSYQDYFVRLRLMPLKVALTILVIAVAVDIVVIVVTWIKTYRHVKQAASVGVSAGLSRTLLRYGILYFLVQCTCNLVNLLSYIIPTLDGEEPLLPFVTTLPNIVLSRFLINLHQANSPASSNVARFSRFSTPNFRMPTLPDIIGSLGEPLPDGDQVLDNEEQRNAEESLKVGSHEPPSLGGKEEPRRTSHSWGGEIEEIQRNPIV